MPGLFIGAWRWVSLPWKEAFPQGWETGWGTQAGEGRILLSSLAGDLDISHPVPPRGAEEWDRDCWHFTPWTKMKSLLDSSIKILTSFSSVPPLNIFVQGIKEKQSQQYPKEQVTRIFVTFISFIYYFLFFQGLSWWWDIFVRGEREFGKI